MSASEQRTPNPAFAPIQRLRTGVAGLAMVITLGLSVSSWAKTSTENDWIVKTETGLVSGVVRHGVIEYRGIPYAASPGGEHRWTLPRPASAWTGVRDGTHFGGACPQVARFNLTEASDNEDCLTVNVSVPQGTKPGSQLPVLVWIHGGAFVGGSSSLYRLDWMAKTGVVTVTVNYRLGVFGFMAHPAFDPVHNGNLGLEDQRFAFAWVQRNIAAFGGNPNKVTIGGESAGAGSTCMHLAAPEKVKGLFQQAVIWSAGCLQTMPTTAQAQEVGLQVAKGTGCTDPANALACLRSAPLKTLLDAGTVASGAAVVSFSPSVGAQTNPVPFATAVHSGQVANVPLLMGGQQNELRLYVGYDQQAGKGITADNYAGKLKAIYGSTPAEQQRGVPEAVLREYPLTKALPPPEQLGSLVSDYNPAVGLNNCLYLRTAAALVRHTTVHEFEFTDPNAPVLGVGIPAKPDPKMKFGAAHSAGLNYLFPKLSNTSLINAPDLPAASQKLSTQMLGLWSSFVKTGTPQHKGVATWPPFSGGATVMRLAPGKVGLFDAGMAHKCDFWRSQYPDVLALN